MRVQARGRRPARLHSLHLVTPLLAGLGTLAPGATLALEPEMAVSLDGTYYDDTIDGHGDQALNETVGALAGHDHGSDAHGLDQGLNLRPTEIRLGATIADGFDARLTAAISDEGDIELEEAFAAADLPAGLRLKAGRFYSGIGYQNERHRHAWSFVDQNLAYRTLLGEHGLSDTGLQLTWRSGAHPGFSLGVEAFEGDNNERLGTAAAHADHLPPREDAPRLWTTFIKVMPVSTHDHELQLGASAAFFRSHQEHHEEGEPDEHALDGDARLYGLDAVYHFDAPGPHGQGDWRLAGEYLRAEKHLIVTEHAGNPAAVGESRDFVEDGVYLQATYGIAPRWEIGLRYDAAGLTNALAGPRPSVDADYDESQRWTAAATWHLGENSHLRAQVARVNAALDEGREHYTQFYLQYQWRLAIGGHRHTHAH